MLEPHQSQIVPVTSIPKSSSSSLVAAPSTAIISSQQQLLLQQNRSSISRQQQQTCDLEVTIHRPSDYSTTRSNTVVINSVAPSSSLQPESSSDVQNISSGNKSNSLFSMIATEGRQSSSTSSFSHPASSQDGKLLAVAFSQKSNHTSSFGIQIRLVSDFFLKDKKSNNDDDNQEETTLEISNPSVFSSRITNLQFSEQVSTQIHQEQRFGDQKEEEGEEVSSDIEIITTTTTKTYLLASTCQHDVQIWGIQRIVCEEETFDYSSSSSSSQHQQNASEVTGQRRVLSTSLQVVSHHHDENVKEPLVVLKGHRSSVTSISLSGPMLGGLFSYSTTNSNHNQQETEDQEQDQQTFFASSASKFQPQLLASSSADETLRVWEITPVMMLKNPSSSNNSPEAQMSRYGSSSSLLPFIKVNLLSTCIGHDSFINSVSISRDGLSLASGGEGDCCIRLWNSWDGKLKQQRQSFISSDDKTGNNTSTNFYYRDLLLRGHGSFINCVAFSPVSDEGLILISSSLDRTIRVWDTSTGSQKFMIDESKFFGTSSSSTSSSPSCITLDFCLLSTDYQNRLVALVANYENGIIRLWNSQNGNLIREVQNKSVENDSASSSSSSSCCVVNVDPHQIHLESSSSSISSSSATTTSKSRSTSAISVGASRSGSYLQNNNNSRSVSILTQQYHQDPNQQQQNNSSSERKIPFIFSSSSLELTDARSGVLLSRPLLDNNKKNSSYVYSVSFAPKNDSMIMNDGNTVLLLAASAHGDGSVKLWIHRQHSSSEQQNEADQNELTAIDLPIKHSGKARSVSFSNDGRLLVSASEDKTIHVWDLYSSSSRNLLGRRINNNNSSNVLQPVLKRFLVNSSGSSSSSTPAGVLTGHTSYVYQAVFCDNTNFIASCSHDKTVRIWDHVESGKEVAILEGHTKDVVGVAFSSASSLLASCSHDKTICVWKILLSAITTNRKTTTPTLAELAFPPLRGHTAYVNTVSFSPNGTILASAGDDKTIRFWNMKNGNPVYCAEPGNEKMLLLSSSPTIRANNNINNSSRRNMSPMIFAGAHSSWIYSLAFSQDGTILVSSSRDRTLCVWNVQEITAKEEEDEQEDNNQDLVISVSASDPSSFFLRSPPLLGHLGRVRSVSLQQQSQDNTNNSSSSHNNTHQLVISGGADGMIRLWSIPQTPFASLLMSNKNINQNSNNNNNNNINNFVLEIELPAPGSALEEAKLVGGKSKSFMALTFSNYLTNTSELKIFPWRPQYEHHQSRLFLMMQEVISLEKIFRAHLQFSELHHHRRIAVLNHEIDTRFELMRGQVFDVEKIFRVSREAKAVSALLWWIQLEERQDRIRIRMNRYVDVELGVRQWIWMQFLTLNPITRRERLIATRQLQQTQQPQTQQQQSGRVSPPSSSDPTLLLTARVNGPEVIVRKGRSIILKLRGHMRTVTCGAFSSDGLALVTASGAENRMMLWRLSDGRLATDYRVVRHPKYVVMNEVGWTCENTLLWSRDEDANVCGYQIYGRKLKYKNENEKNRIIPLPAGPCLGCGTFYETAPFDWKCTNCQNPADIWPLRFKPHQERKTITDGDDENNNIDDERKARREEPSPNATLAATTHQTNPVSQTYCLFCGTDFRQTAARVRCGGCAQFVCERCVAIQDCPVWSQEELSQVEVRRQAQRKSNSATSPVKKTFPVCYDCCARCADLPPHLDPVEQLQKQQEEKEQKEKEKEERKNNEQRPARSPTRRKVTENASSVDNSNTKKTSSPTRRHPSPPLRRRDDGGSSNTNDDEDDDSSSNDSNDNNQKQLPKSSRSSVTDITQEPARSEPRSERSNASSAASTAASLQQKQQQFLINALDEILKISDAVSIATVCHSFNWMEISLKDTFDSSESTRSLMTEEFASILLKQVPNKSTGSSPTLETISVGSSVAYALRSVKEKILALDADITASLKQQQQQQSSSSPSSNRSPSSSSASQIQKQNFLVEKAVHSLAVPLANCLSLFQTAATVLCRITSNTQSCALVLRKLISMQNPVIRFSISSLISQYFSIVYSSSSSSSGGVSPSPPPFSTLSPGGSPQAVDPTTINNNNNSELAASIINMTNFFSSRDSQSSAGSRRSYPQHQHQNPNHPPISPTHHSNSRTPPSRIRRQAEHDANQHQQQQQQQTLLFERDIKILYDFEEKFSIVVKDAVSLCKKFTTSMELTVQTASTDSTQNDAAAKTTNSNNNGNNDAITVLNRFGTVYYALIINELKFVDIADQIYNQLLIAAPASLQQPSSPTPDNEQQMREVSFLSSLFNFRKHDRVLSLVFTPSSSDQNTLHHQKLLASILFETALKDVLLYNSRREQSFIGEKVLSICAALQQQQQKPLRSLKNTNELNDLPLIVISRSSITFGGKIGSPGEFSTARKCIMNGVPVVLKTYNSGNNLLTTPNSTVNSSTGSLLLSPTNENNNIGNNNNSGGNVSSSSNLHKQIATSEFKLLKRLMLKHNIQREFVTKQNYHIVHTFGILDDGCSVVLEYLGDSLSTRLEKYWTTIVQHQNETGFVKPSTLSFFTTASTISPGSNDTSNNNTNPSSPSASPASSPLRRGELIDYKSQQTRDRENIAAFRITISLLLALIELHTENVHHRDLRPSNVFFSLKGSCDTTAKLVDFSHAVLPAAKSSWHARVSTILQRKEFDKIRYEEQERQQIQQPEEFSNVDFVNMKGFDRQSTGSNNNYLSSDPATPHKRRDSISSQHQQQQSSSSYTTLATKPLPWIQKCDESLLYAPPESFRNFLDRPSSIANPSSSEEIASDMFSLGVVLVELWTKRKAYHSYEKNPQLAPLSSVNNENNYNKQNNNINASTLKVSPNAPTTSGSFGDEDDEEVYSICNPPPHDELVRMKLTGLSPFPSGLYSTTTASSNNKTKRRDSASSSNKDNNNNSNDSSFSTTTRKFPLSIKTIPPVIALLITSLCAVDPAVRPSATFVKDQLAQTFFGHQQDQQQGGENGGNTSDQLKNLETLSDDVILSVLNTRRNQVDPCLFGAAPSITVSSSEDEQHRKAMIRKPVSSHHQNSNNSNSPHISASHSSNTSSAQHTRSSSTVSQHQQPQQPNQPGALSVNVSSNSSVNDGDVGGIRPSVSRRSSDVNSANNSKTHHQQSPAHSVSSTAEGENSRQNHPTIRVQPMQPSALLTVPSSGRSGGGGGGGGSRSGSSSNRSSAQNSKSTTPSSSSSAYSWMKNLEVADDVKELLKKQMLDEKSFLLLNDDDLKEMQVPIGPRKLLLKEIKERSEKRENLKRNL